ncbi:hypothetical protein ACIBSV_10040 [Embleya sp. NPDC050154]|uniref:hypothetical protein n=1 Tax=unclassified Embleya TaxID=2699296 RepID=UPI00379C4E12
MNEFNPPLAYGRRNVRASGKSPLVRTVDLLPRLRAWALARPVEGVNVADVSSIHRPDWTGNLAPLSWTTATPTLPLAPRHLDAIAEGIGRLDGALHRALTFEPIHDGTAVLAHSGEFTEELGVFADQRRVALMATAHLPQEHPHRSLIPPSGVDAVLSAPAGTVVWSMGPDDVRVDPETGDTWLLGCGAEPTHGPFGANLADIVSRLGHHRLEHRTLHGLSTHYNRGLVRALGGMAPHLSPAVFAVLVETAATGPVGSEAPESERWAAVRPDEFEVLVPLGLKHLSAPEESS